jgi:hypothetical protein
VTAGAVGLHPDHGDGVEVDLDAGAADDATSEAVEFKQVENERLITFLRKLTAAARRSRIDVTRPWFRALAGNAARLSALERTVAGSAFTHNPEQDEIGRISGILSGLQAAHEVAGVLGAGAAGRRSGASRRADTAKRDRRVRELWDAAPGFFPTLIARGRYVVRTMREKGWPADEIPTPRAVVRIATRK